MRAKMQELGTAGGTHRVEAQALTAAVRHLLPGRRPEAVELLRAALERSPEDPRLAHALLLACFHALAAGDRSLAAGAVAAWGALVHRREFWRRWLTQRLAVYGVEAGAAGLEEKVKQALEGLLLDVLEGEDEEGRPLAGLLAREVAAAGELAALGGLPPAERPDREAAAGTLVCGPLMLGLVRRERLLGGLVADFPEPGEPAADRVLRLLDALAGRRFPSPLPAAAVDPRTRRRLQRLFSSLGVAQALLDQRRPAAALAALERLGCPACAGAAAAAPAAAATAPLAVPPAGCAPDCPRFEERNPGYAGLRDGGGEWRRDAAGLAAAAHLDLAREQLAAAVPELAAVCRSWEQALALAGFSGEQEATRRRLVADALGRAASLERGRRLEAAVALLQAAREVSNVGVDGRAGGAAGADAAPAAAAAGEIDGRLAELLFARGVAAGRERRWPQAVDDLAAAVALNPHAVQPRVNLARARRNWAGELQRHDPAGAIELLSTAVRELEQGRRLLPDRAELERQHRRARAQAAAALVARAAELAREGGFEQAMRVLEEGRRRLPDDRRLARHYRSTLLAYAEALTARGQQHRAVRLLRRIVRDSGGGS